MDGMPSAQQDTPPVITRLRYGLATNSSSSHSMVVLAPGEDAFDEIPGGERHVYANGWLAASADEKRQVLAGMLVAQSCELWGRGVTLPKRGVVHDQVHENQRDEIAAQVHAQPRDTFDSRPAGRAYSPDIDDLTLPAWLQEEIKALCGLSTLMDVSRHWTDSDLVGGALALPRSEADMGPDPVAWAAFMTVVMDVRTVLAGPLPNDAHPLQRTHHATTRHLSLALKQT